MKLNVKPKCAVFLIIHLLLCLHSYAGEVSYKVSDITGGIISISASDNMNWIISPDRTQYEWVGSKYAWGLGFLSIDGVKHSWDHPSGKTRNTLIYRTGNIKINIKRYTDNGDLVEEYEFMNISGKTVALSDIGIFTPWNDNYPDASTCMTSRCNAHVWAGGSAAWVKAMRMNGHGPHIGMIVTEGAIDSYEILERDKKKGLSNFRGIITMNVPDMKIESGRKYKLSWRIFTHNGGDFDEKVINRGGVIVSAPKYVYEKGETAEITFRSARETKTIRQKITRIGEIRMTYKYSEGRHTWADILAVSGEDKLIEKRADFITARQQMDNPADPRHGAYMVYDNEGDSILSNDFGRSDLDEGRERVGMGIFLAEYYKKNPSAALLESLSRYAAFIRKLQDHNYKTTSNVRRQTKNRGYNYAWVADFWFRMYDITGNKDYARNGYGTMKALFRQFGHNFYCIDYPVTTGLKALGKAGMTAERDTLLSNFRKVGNGFVSRGLDFPHHEVNYEQSIIAPAVQFLCELYLETKEKKYLNGAELMLPALEAFAGGQPSFRMNGIAIRHWDGYWFGKRQTWGDVYPHYWSTITAGAYHYYAIATGKTKYQELAKNIVRNNLCLFFEDGRATCAFVYPKRVNGEKTHFADAYANDQDFALMFYLLVNN